MANADWNWSEPDWRGACYVSIHGEKFARIEVVRNGRSVYEIIDPSGSITATCHTVKATNAWIDRKTSYPGLSIGKFKVA